MIRSRQPPLTKTFIGSNSCLNNLASVDASIRGESLSHSGFPHFIAAQTKPDTDLISTSQGVNHATFVEATEKVWQGAKRIQFRETHRHVISFYTHWREDNK